MKHRRPMHDDCPKSQGINKIFYWEDVAAVITWLVLWGAGIVVIATRCCHG